MTCHSFAVDRLSMLGSTSSLEVVVRMVKDCIHDRMPMILDEEAQKIWMDHSGEDTGHLGGLLRTFSSAKRATSRYRPW